MAKKKRVGRPKLPKSEKRVSRSIAMKPALWSYVKQVAAENGCSKNDAFEMILRRDME